MASLGRNELFMLKKSGINSTGTYMLPNLFYVYTLPWRQNERHGISNHQTYDCLLNADQRKHVTGKFPAQMASNAENVSIWWRHNVPDARGAFH